MAFTQESCDITIPTDPERLSVAPKDVATEGLNLIFFLVEREGQRIPGHHRHGQRQIAPLPLVTLDTVRSWQGWGW